MTLEEIKKKYIRWQILKIKTAKQRRDIVKAVKEANEQGISYQKIAKALGITTQAVHQIAKEQTYEI